MEYSNKQKFPELQDKILNILFSDDETKDFAAYFKSNYAPRPQKWAFWYESGTGIDKNNRIFSREEK